MCRGDHCVARGRSQNAPTMWRFESVHGFASVGNLYQKMHFAGSNLSTDAKSPKCIYKILKNFRVEKSGEISRNLRFSRFFVPTSKSDTHHVTCVRFRCKTVCGQFRCTRILQRVDEPIGDDGSCT